MILGRAPAPRASPRLARNATALWLVLTAAAGAALALGTLLGPSANLIFLALLFCGTCGVWMSFAGRSADHEAGWLLMLGWGIVVQIAGPVAFIAPGASLHEIAIVPAMLTGPVLWVGTRSRLVLLAPAIGGAAIYALGVWGFHPLTWGLGVWLAIVSAAMGAWAARARAHEHLVLTRGRCGCCRYDLRDLDSPQCPECGFARGSFPPAA
ncbi:MAG: hypothetical protein SFY69_05870 [Planctomycetota bacterium]|nr:hypothetical protein [Planctomycetota bacterium]